MGEIYNNKKQQSQNRIHNFLDELYLLYEYISIKSFLKTFVSQLKMAYDLRLAFSQESRQMICIWILCRKSPLTTHLLAGRCYE